MNFLKNHEQLLKYKNLHNEEICYIVATGKTFNAFKMQEEGSIIGVNLIIKSEKILNNPNFKYYFFGHGYKYNHSVWKDNKEIVDKLKIDKFCFPKSGRGSLNDHGFVNEDLNKFDDKNTLLLELNNVDIHKNIDKNPFINHSIVYSACQFALYAGFKKIYLVGCDCSNFHGSGNQYFLNNDSITPEYENDIQKSLITWWGKMFEFKNKEYPNSKIININPIGLKGKMDQDIYT